MARMNVEKMTLKELLELQDTVADAIGRKRVEQRASLKAQIAALAAESGFSVEELLVGKRGRKAGNGASVEAKYRNTDNAEETWAGRGRQPRWLAAQLKKGVKLEKFLIN